VGLDAAFGSAHAHPMPRARSAVRDLLLAIAMMANALVRADAVQSVIGLLRDAIRTRVELLAETPCSVSNCSSCTDKSADRASRRPIARGW
jgi:hypothetical protein